MKAFPKNIEIATMTERHVGIENELGVGEDRYGNLPILASLAIKRRGLLHSVGSDGGGREFRTNPISLKSIHQIRGNKYLCDYYDVLKKHTFTQSSGGTHVHISILGSDHENMESNATAMGIAFFKQFQKISGRNTHWASRHPGDSLEHVRTGLSRIRYGARQYHRRSYMLNPTEHQTLEFRGPRGSNDSSEILAWIEFIENVVKVCNRESIEGVQFKQLLKGTYLEPYAKGKFTKEELGHTFNGARLYYNGVRLY